ncbi:hypothetical protein ACPPVT_00310 [Angustibacter sp. McL0619]|uniref:hypothetical protein n=1 Tax=Angustibacter sp. McL0619 TaxID=3415676 RepID=UPI003CEA8918
MSDERPATRRGAGRVLIAVYALFAVAATSRALYQLATRFHEAPLAYLLSAFAAVVYIVATVALARGGPTWTKVAMVSCTIELVGVLVVGTLSVVRPDDFPDATVWSDFGAGYGFVPVVLPVLGLWFLRSTRRAQRGVR